VSRADHALAELGGAAGRVQTELADRIRDAKGAGAVLDGRIAAAAQAGDMLASALETAKVRPGVVARAIQPGPNVRPSPAPVEPLTLVRRVESRSRARVDDDLFAPDEPLRAAAGGGR
jgi:hypothetical protein